MRKKIIAVFMLFLTIAMICISITPKKVLAEIGTDIGGVQIEDSGNMGTNSMGYNLSLSTILKLSLVDVSGNAPAVKDYLYLVYKNTYYYHVLTNNLDKTNEINREGKYHVCGTIEDGKYTSNCISIEEKMELIDDAWFASSITWGTNVSAMKIRNKISNKKDFADIVNKLSIQELIGGKNFDLDNLTNEDINKLSNYRLIVEPVYAFAYESENKPIEYVFATVKGIGKKMITEARTTEGIGVSMSKFATNIYATTTHGSINQNGNLNPENINSIINGADYRKYYEELSDVNSGYGYGIFYIIGGCDPKNSCCYDKDGQYHQEYFGNTKNFKCEDGIQGEYCQTLTPCVAEENPPKKLGCSDTNTTFVEEMPGTVNTERTIYEYYEEEYNYYSNYDRKGSCTTNLTQTITGDVTITQVGNIQTELSPKTVYSGGGFSFNASYKGTASYTLNSLGYTITELYQKYTCPIRAFPNKEINENVIIEYSTVGEPNLDELTCSYEGVMKEKYKTTENCGNDANGKPLQDCDEYKEKPADPVIIPIEKDGCGISTSDYMCEIENPDKWCEIALEAFAEAMSNEFIKKEKSFKSSIESNAQTLSRNSNDENKTEISSPMGSWEVQYEYIPKWYPNAAATYNMKFKPYKACINNRTAEVIYISQEESCSDHNDDTVSYIDGSIGGRNLYYVPLKEKNESNFPVYVNINDISIINDMNWSLEYECGVNCNQKIYNNKGNFNFIYRPIDMANPFPKIVNENRQIGSNWEMFMEDEDAVEIKMNRENLEYSVKLTPDKIASIKQYNTGKNYTNLNTINDNGYSEFLKEYGIINIKNNNYNSLGFCYNECWPTKDDGGEF